MIAFFTTSLCHFAFISLPSVNAFKLISVCEFGSLTSVLELTSELNVTTKCDATRVADNERGISVRYTGERISPARLQASGTCSPV